MTPQAALAAVKSRLDIDTAITDFDAQINQFVTDAVDRLYPTAMQDAGVVPLPCTPDSVTRQSTITLTNLDGFRYIEALGSDGFPYPVDDVYQYGNIVRLRNLSSDTSKVLVYGLKRYTLATIPPELKRAIFYYAMADFYNFLVGNKRKYNVYMSNGRAAVDNMDEIAAGLEAKADAIVDLKAMSYGR